MGYLVFIRSQNLLCPEIPPNSKKINIRGEETKQESNSGYLKINVIIHKRQDCITKLCDDRDCTYIADVQNVVIINVVTN